MNRTTTNLTVCSRTILRRTRPNTKGVIARQLPKYFLKLRQTEPTGLGTASVIFSKIDTYGELLHTTIGNIRKQV